MKKYNNPGSIFSDVAVFVIVLTVLIVTFENENFFVRGYYLHLLPLFVACGGFWYIFNNKCFSLIVLLAILVSTAASSVFLELFFEVYKKDPFDEYGIVTLFSICQLLAIGFTALLLWLETRKMNFSFREMTSIWLIIAIGFFFLAIDEKALIHERMDLAIHGILGMRETWWSDRLDDLLLAVYGVVGIAVLWSYSSEILRFRHCCRLLKIGFVLLFLSVIGDVTANRPDFFVWLFGEASGEPVQALVGGAEELLKVLGETVFLMAFASALLEARGCGSGSSYASSLPHSTSRTL